MTRWKRREREIAARLGGRRVPSSGRSRRDDTYAPDVLHPFLSIEVKARKATPKLLRDGMDQAKLAAKRDEVQGKTPIVVLCEHGRRLDEAYVVLRFEDYEQLISNDVGEVTQ